MTLNASLHKRSLESKRSPESLLIIGCGDIGQRLALTLDPHKYRATGLKRSPAPDLPYLHFRQGDATKPNELSSILTDNFDVIVVSMTPSERSDAGYEHAYVRTCRNLVNALKQQQLRPRLLVFVSSTSVFAQDDGSWVNETSPTAPDSFSGKRLLEAEQIIQASGFAHVIIRFSGIYGPGRNRLIEQVKQLRAANSTHYTNRIHADDCAGVLAHLIELSRTQTLASIYLATDSAPTPMVEVVSWIAEHLGIKDFLADAAVNERGNKRINNQRLLATGYRLHYPDFKQGYKEMLNG